MCFQQICSLETELFFKNKETECIPVTLFCDKLFNRWQHGTGAEPYFEAGTCQDSEIKIGNVKILLVTPRRVEGCDFLHSCRETLLLTSQAAAAAAAAHSALLIEHIGGKWGNEKQRCLEYAHN